MSNKILATESFSLGKRNYFLDFKRADNNSNYIQIRAANSRKTTAIGAGR